MAVHNGIQYVGLPGATRSCQDAVMRLLQYGDRINRVWILTCSGDHCLILFDAFADPIAVKSGFASGYIGEGSHAFSYVLQLLDSHGAEIKEYDVAPALIERVDNSSLTVSDIRKLETAAPIRPTRWHDYVFEKHWEMEHSGTLWREFPQLIPFAIVDSRIMDLAMTFWEDPDNKLLTGYRRLEDIVRKRTGIDEHGAKLFSQAFQGATAKLGWKNIDSGQQTGRGSLFSSVYMAYRNPRAHREEVSDPNKQLAEFLMLNHLFCLEKDSVKRRVRARP